MPRLVGALSGFSVPIDHGEGVGTSTCLAPAGEEERKSNRTDTKPQVVRSRLQAESDLPPDNLVTHSQRDRMVSDDRGDVAAATNLGDAKITGLQA